MTNCVGTSPVPVVPSISLAWNRLIRPLTTKVTLCWNTVVVVPDVVEPASVMTLLTMMLVPPTIGGPRLITNSLF